MKDLLGKAIFDYQTGNDPQPLYTETNISESDEMDIAYMFRSFSQMPEIEKKALKMAYGSVLDIGCGAGSHTLYLQEKGCDVRAVDVSEYAVKTCRLRGVKNVEQLDVLEVKNQKFDTILLLMNGTGIFGRLKNVAHYLTHLKSLLKSGGQILIDSTDLIYMFDEDEDGGKWIPMQGDYYGELTFYLSYKNEKEAPFPWLYLDYNTLQNVCVANGLQCELVYEGDHYDYLARIR